MEQKRGFQKLVPWVLSFVMLLGVLAAKYLLPESPVYLQKEKEPQLMLATTYEAIPPRRMTSRTGADLTVLCDGDAATAVWLDRQWEITLDLGKVHMLGGVRFLPAGDTQTELDRCQGMLVSLSKDNYRFQKAAVAEPLDDVGYTKDWKELSFGGAGEFRYVRLTLPAGAKLAEVACLGYPDWSFQRGRRAGYTDCSLGLYAYDAKAPVSANILAGVFNENGVLKALTKTEEEVLPQEGKPVHLKVSVPSHGIGDRYRVMAWSREGESLLNQDLNLCYTQGGMAFSMPNLFSNAMMLQAEKPMRVWGNAPMGSKVKLVLQNASGVVAEKETKADANSDWEADLGSFPYGGEYTLTVSCGEKTKTVSDLTFGDVWLLTGQSNMEYHMLGGADTAAYLQSAKGKQEANNPNIRLLSLWNKGPGGSGGSVSNFPVGYRNPAWSRMNADAAAYCSAIGYFFANQIQQAYGIPVGLISAAVGDTEINRWVPYGARYGSFSGTDGGLYYSRVMPASRLAVRGILMYQGESDEYRTHLSAEEYRDALCGLIDHYRSIWGEDVPFYWAQLTRYARDESQIREGQRLALSGVKNPRNIGMISLMDVYGEFRETTGNCREDIHPHQKQVAAQRFFRLASRDVYGGTQPAEGPVYLSARQMGNKLELTFRTTGSLCVMDKSQYADAKGQKRIKENGMDETTVQELEVAGTDGVFYPAKAELQGATLLVWSEQVAHPVQARYGWGAYPEMPNLTDASMLPAPAFVTEVTIL